VLSIVSSSINKNLAQGGMAGIGGQAGSGQGGGIEVETLGSLSVTSSTISDNQALGGQGSIGGPGSGGGLFINATATLSLSGVTITLNQATGGPGPVAGPGSGGGIYLALGSLATKDSTTLIFTNHSSTTANDVFGWFLPSWF
jgi:hypothetical protein